MKKLINLNKEELVQRLWRAEPRIESILQNSRHVEEGRHVVFDYLDRLRRDLYNMKAGTYYSELNVVEKETSGSASASFQTCSGRRTNI